MTPLLAFTGESLPQQFVYLAKILVFQSKIALGNKRPDDEPVIFQFPRQLEALLQQTPRTLALLASAPPQ